VTPASRSRLVGAVLVSVFAALLVLPPVGRHLIVKSDEARFALLARDMVQRGTWFAAEVEGERYRNKPPLFPWSIALLSRLGGGVTETTAQLPAATAAIVAVLFTFLLGDRLFGRRAGVWAALILLTSASFFSHSQQILPDMLVVAFGTAAGYAFWLAMTGPRQGPALVGFYAALALAVFAKGPVGLLPLVVAAIWLVTEHGAPGLRRMWSLGGVAVFAVVTLAWLLPFLGGGSQSFGQNVLWSDWLLTYIGPPLLRRVLNFVLDAMVGLLPWTPVAVLAVAWAVRSRTSAPVRFALLSFAIPFLVIILSRSRLPRYLMPIYPGAALLIAWWAETHGASRTPLGRLLGWVSFLGVVAALAALPAVPAIRESGVLLQPGIVWLAMPLLAGAFLIGVVFVLGLTRGRPALVVYGGVGVMAVVLGYGSWVVNGFTDRTENFKALAASIQRHTADTDLRVFTRAKLLPLDFYFGRELPRLATVTELQEYVTRDGRPTVLIDQQNLKVAPRELVQELRVLETLTIHEQRLYLLGCAPAERSAGSARCPADDRGPLEPAKR
jgi:4-amino-4-deoxy-L-arabinose transferase